MTDTEQHCPHCKRRFELEDAGAAFRWGYISCPGCGFEFRPKRSARRPEA